MIDLLPVPQDRFACPCGAGELTVNGFHLPGMVPFARTTCAECGNEYLAHLHVGFCSNHDFIVEPKSGAVHSTVTARWYRDFLIAATQSLDSVPAPVERRTRRATGDDVLLLNCLDPVYGHCLHRLFSLDAYRRHGFSGSVIAIVPRFLAWLVPDDVDELWIVDVALRRSNLGNQAIAAMADGLASRVSRLRYASMAYGHDLDIARYTGVEPFAVRGHDSVSPPRLTINWREDRCWTTGGKRMDDQAAVADQLRLYRLLLEALRKEAPDLDAAVTGYGRTGTFQPWVQDLRIVEHDTEAERGWATRYSESHLSIGIHGSNTILPAALSLGALELVVTRFWPHILVTWEWVNRMRASEALARFRQIPVSASVSDIASVALMQLRRMQGSAGYALMGKLQATETAGSIMFRHAGAFQHSEPIVVHDENGAEM